MAFTASDIKNLREMTGAGMMECKKALTECNGNIDEAAKYLKEKGLAAAAKRADRATAEGRLFIRQEGNKIYVVEMTCETDFVANNADFVALGEKMLDVTIAKGYTKVEEEHNKMLEDLKARGVYVAEVTLHVGPGTFQNISVEDFTQHKMHGEHYELTKENAEIINKAKREGGRIVTVGTTSTRVVETIADANGIVKPQAGVTHAFFYPGYRYKIVDGLLTNFHWPKSSLILLVSAFYGRENTLAAYKMAVENKLKLFSYGDGMLIL